MADSRYDLTDEEREKFFRNSERLGFAREQVAGSTLMTKDLGNESVGALPIPTLTLSINNVQELKARVGVPDPEPGLESVGYDDEGIEYPTARAPEFLSEASHLGMSDEERDEVTKALRAYVVGNSGRVSDLGWEPVINATRFPLEATVVAAETVIVAPSDPLKLGVEPAASFGKVVLEPGARIEVVGDFKGDIVNLQKET